MAIENVVLMREARETLKGKWGLAIGVFLLYMVVTVVVGSPSDIGPILQLLIAGPLLLGLSIFFLGFSRGEEVAVSLLFAGFHDFLRSFVAHLLRYLFIGLWTLLLIVPGIIAALAYSQTFFILAEDKSVTAGEAIKKSKAMMYGHKKRLFYLGLRFFGWFLLGILTLGIGLLWVMPYFQVTLAKFYDDVSGKRAAQEVTA